MKYIAERTHFTFPPGLKRRIDDFAGKRSRSQLVVEILEEGLARRELAESAKAAAGALAGRGIPEWSTPESTSRWVRSIRREADESMRRAHGQ